MPLDMIKDGHLGGYVHGGDPGTWCPNLWRWLVETYEIRSVLDVGCGEGQSTRYFQELGCEVLGVDGCPQAIGDSVIPGHVALHDFCSGAFDHPRRFDLVWSCEFVEHLEQRYLRNILQTFSHAAKVVAITHAFPGQPGHHHVNCQPTGYWIRHIESWGFRCGVEASRAARRVTLADHPKINHFARSGLVFERHEPARLVSPPSSAWQAWWKGQQINLGFRLSAPCRQQRRQYRAAKRRRRREERRQAA